MGRGQFVYVGVGETGLVVKVVLFLGEGGIGYGRW